MGLFASSRPPPHSEVRSKSYRVFRPRQWASLQRAAGPYIRVNHVTLAVCWSLPVYPQHRTWLCTAITDAMCQNLKSRVHFVGIGTGKKRPASRPTFRFTPARGGRAGADEGPP